MRCRKGFKNVDITNELFFFRKMQSHNCNCVQTVFLTRVIQFVCTHRRSYLSKKNNPLFQWHDVLESMTIHSPLKNDIAFGSCPWGIYFQLGTQIFIYPSLSCQLYKTNRSQHMCLSKVYSGFADVTIVFSVKIASSIK